MTDEPTVGELGRTLERFIVEVDRRFNELGVKIDSKLVDVNYYTARHEAIEARIAAVEKDVETIVMERMAERQMANTNARQLVLLIVSNLVFPILIAALIAAGSIRLK